MQSRTARRGIALIAAAVLSLSLAPAALAGAIGRARRRTCEGALRQHACASPRARGATSKIVKTRCFARLAPALRFAAKGAAIPDDVTPELDRRCAARPCRGQGRRRRSDDDHRHPLGARGPAAGATGSTSSRASISVRRGSDLADRTAGRRVGDGSSPPRRPSAAASTFTQFQKPKLDRHDTRLQPVLRQPGAVERPGRLGPLGQLIAGIPRNSRDRLQEPARPRCYPCGRRRLPSRHMTPRLQVDRARSRSRPPTTRTTRALVRRLTVIVGDPHEAEDLAQTTFERALGALDRFDGGDVRGWLYTIGVRLAINESRRRRRLNEFLSRLEPDLAVHRRGSGPVEGSAGA